MSLALELTLCAAIAALTIFLVLLLIQARRTAAAVERLAESATRDLRQISEDIHEVRVRTVETTTLIQRTLELPSALTQVVAGIVRAIPSFFSHRSEATSFLDALLTGAQTALHLFRSPRPQPSKEESHE